MREMEDNKSLAELLYRHYPDLNQKEFAICDIIAGTQWDIGDGLYVEVVARAENTTDENLKIIKRQDFKNTEEIEDVINGLIKKGIIKKFTHNTKYDGGSRIVPEEILDWQKDNITGEIYKIFSGQQPI